MAISQNEKRIALGLEPLEELEGKRMQSLNYIDVNLAQSYQMKHNKLKDNEGGVV